MALKCSDMNVYYGSSHVVRSLSVEINEGETVVLMGRNGSAKSTTMKAIAGVLPMRSGSVSIDGMDVSEDAAFKRIASGLALVPQGGRLFASLTVRENLEIVRGASQDVKTKLAHVSERVPLVRKLLDRPAAHLSGGERQLVAMARGLMADSSYLLLDEPTEGMAPLVQETIAELIQEMKGAGTGLMVAEHNYKFALEIADRGYIIERGQVVFQGSGSDFTDSGAFERYLTI